MSITLKPVPDGATVTVLPRQPDDDREVVVRQFSSLLALMVQRHGAYQGRQRYIEASVAAVTRLSFEEGTLHDTRNGLVEAMDEELDRLEPAAPGFM